jgi:hypothetical protein
LFGDDAAIAAFERVGVSREDARYTIVGCAETIIPGGIPAHHGYSLNLDKCLELALNDGRCRLSAEQLGPRTGDPRPHRLRSDHGDLPPAGGLLHGVGDRRGARRLEVSPQFVPVPFLSATKDHARQRPT